MGFCVFGTGALQASEVTVDASLSSLSFPWDRAARLTITVNGTSRNADIEIPEIDNIRLQNQGTSSQISMVNGTISSSISHNYLVQALQPGSYTIPSIKVTAGGNVYSTKPLNFQVTPVGQQQKGPATNSAQTTDQIAFLRISTTTGTHYSGEIVPLTIKAYFSQAYRADINSLPALNGDGVVMSQLQDKPEQTEESVSGRMYHVLTWDTSLTGIKVGEHPIHFTLDATLLIPQKRRSLSPFGGNSLFDDSFFNDPAIDSFFGNTQRKPIVSTSPEIGFKVLPLPTDNQPDNFTGAIGDFDLKVTATPVIVEIGEPMTLTMEISGTGNFDRVEVPTFPESPNWKTYSPTSNFTALGKSYAGAKTFEQAIVARSGAVAEIPPLSFGYFDPAQKKYITKTSKAVAIHVNAPENTTAAQPVQPVQDVVIQPPQPANQTLSTASARAIAGLAPIHLETGTYHERIIPLFKQIWFIAVCALCIFTLLTLSVLWIRKQNIEKHPEIERQKKKKVLLEDDLKRVAEAQAKGDGPAFLGYCRMAMQNQLGRLWDIEPTALSLADLKNRLNTDSHLIEIFSAAEEAAYGGATLTEGKMQDYIITLQRELENLL